MSPVRATGGRWERLDTLRKILYITCYQCLFFFCPYEEESQYLAALFNDIFNFN